MTLILPHKVLINPEKYIIYMCVIYGGDPMKGVYMSQQHPERDAGFYRAARNKAYGGSQVVGSLAYHPPCAGSEPS